MPAYTCASSLCFADINLHVLEEHAPSHSIWHINRFLCVQLSALPQPSRPRADIQMEGAGACLQAGGVCARPAACPTAARSAQPSARCPGDAVCCHTIPTTARGCEERGGQCRAPSLCGGAPRDGLGRCSGGHVCCVLIF